MNKNVILFIFLQVLDVVTTLLSLRTHLTTEVNPFINFVSLYLGFDLALILIKVIGGISILYMFKKDIDKLKYINWIFMIVCASNILITGFLIWII